MLHTPLNVFYVLFLVCLTSLTDIKLGPVQVSEFVALLGLIVVGPMLLFKTRLPNGRADRVAVTSIYLFFSMIIAGAVLAFIRGDFFLPGQVDSLFRQPGWISGARVFQMFLVYTCFAAIVYTSMQDRQIVGRCVRLYIYGLTFSSLYGIVSFGLMVGTGIEIGGAYGETGVRLRAFFVEGGPFGLFAASGLLMLAAQWRRQYLSRRATYVCGFFIIVALLLAQSKAAIFALVLTMMLAVLFTGFKVLKAYLLPLLAALLVIGGLALFAGAGDALEAIFEGRETLLTSPEVIGDDPNVIAGRIAGSIIVPNMIAAHPFFGVGIGNYSLTRNSPDYNQVLPTLEFWDLHGLGLYGFLAEVGFIACILFVIFLLTPALNAKRAGAPFGVIMLCCFPLIAFLFGVQPTFLYPWVVCAIGVAMVRDLDIERTV